MEYKKIRAIGTGLLVALWLCLTLFSWFSPVKDISETERRPLAQWPEITLSSLLDGRFMEKFDSYTLDQFPLRDTFREIKSLFHYYVLQQKDNNGIYLKDGYAAKLEYPLDTASVQRATDIFQNIYDTYLKEAGCTSFMAVAPDKGYYLGQENGYPTMDYDLLFSHLQKNMPWATHISLTDCLSIADYYKTDTHWRQENLIPVAEKISNALGVTPPKESDFTPTALSRPFYGVYYGQAALPMKPETLTVLNSELLSACKVYNFETKAYTQVYDMEKQTSKDLYDVFLSGSQSLLTIENPNAATNRELIIFRDSFGSSLAPLLVQDYTKVTLVDIRYINRAMLENYITFQGQDVLFLYSTLVLNASQTMK